LRAKARLNYIRRAGIESSPGEVACVHAGQMADAHEVFVDGAGGFAAFVEKW
jgi:hypothetical protein